MKKDLKKKVDIREGRQWWTKHKKFNILWEIKEVEWK